MDWFTKQQDAYQARAQTWLLSRPDKQVDLPGQLNLVVAIGVPCPDCKKLIHRHGELGHTARWVRAVGGAHWASGITVSCKA